MRYKITAIVEIDRVGDSLKAIAPFADETPDITKIEDGKAERKPPTISPTSQTRGGKAILAWMAPTNVYGTKDLETALSDAGMKRTSVSSIMSGLVREGKVNKLGRNQFQIAPTNEATL